ncbi:hypothetical protein [Flavobacterium phragmitis]|uniref:Peptidase propeptide and YPEB domain-containing protein n=1 Tax=Flavobacterium phragmitis TaxID=739143 RepID=A0A1I1U2P0_9FLAO|nr:hypothetical protein [Flavobacterium phragmitis]SFD62100.1 hypothetical protein SAMN05216297_11015 [Flavobacterium phragmitis]
MKKNITSALIVLFIGISICFTSCKEKNKDEVKITEKQALQIAKRYGITGDSIEISFQTYIYAKSTLGYQKGKRKLYYWDISKKCNQCPFIQIDAVTGNVFSEGKYTYVY